MFDELKTPNNNYVKSSLSQLLTAPLAKLLRNRRPWELLQALSENVENVTKIWNMNMRQELLLFVLKIDQNRPLGSRENDLYDIQLFEYSCLKHELCIGGVYLRIFIKSGGVTDNIDDPSTFCRELLIYIENFVFSNNASNNSNNTSTTTTNATNNSSATTANNNNTNTNNNNNINDSTNELITREHQEYAIEALKTLVCARDYIVWDILNYPVITHNNNNNKSPTKRDRDTNNATTSTTTSTNNSPNRDHTNSNTETTHTHTGLEIIYSLLIYNQKYSNYASITQLLARLTEYPQFIQQSVDASNSSLVMWKLLTCICTTNHPSISYAWTACESIASHPDGLHWFINTGVIIHLLSVIFGVTGYISSFSSRISAVNLLSKFVWNPVKGSTASAMLRRFLPEPLVILLKNNAGSSTLNLFDDICETPGMLLLLYISTVIIIVNTHIFVFLLLL